MLPNWFISLVGDELSVVLVGRHHECVDAFEVGFVRYGADDVVRLKSIHLQDRDMIGSEDILDDRHSQSDVLRSLLSLRFISRESLVSERLSVVESDGEMSWFFLGQYLVERIAEAHYRARIHSFGIDARCFDEGVVTAVYQRVCVDEKEFVH